MSALYDRRILTLAVKPVFERAIRAAAKQEGKTTSELLREAARQYILEKSLAKIERYGEKIAARLGVETYDDVERIGR